MQLIHLRSVVKLLLRHGAKTSALDQDSKAALFFATVDEQYVLSKLLLENGAHIDAQNSFGWCSLHACLHTPRTDRTSHKCADFIACID